MKSPIIRYVFTNHVLATAFILLFFLFLLQVKVILIDLFISYIIMAALSPFVTMLTRKKVPNVIASTITYLVMVILLFILIFPLVPFFISQIALLIKSFPLYLDNTAHVFGMKVDFTQVQAFLGAELTNLGENAYSITKSIFNGFFSFLTVMVIGFYLLLDKKNIQKSLIGYFPLKMQNHAEITITEIEEKLGSWVRGQILLSVFIGVLTWIMLTVLGIPFALPLALIAGILEIVPTLGPIISAIPAMIVALSISPTLALIVAAGYLGIQMLENNLLVPKIMEHAVGLNPIIIIVTVGIGANLLGVIGALLAIPFLSALIILVRDIRKYSEE
jgi:predicted PurR-regulated permease PerM